MNNVFKVIWDSSAQCWVAVSELARSKTKSTSDKRAQPSKVLVALGLAGMALSSGSAVAVTASEVIVNSQQGSVTSGGRAVMVTTDSNTNSIAIGGAAGHLSGNNSQLAPANASTGGVAIGANTAAAEGSTALSYSANASGKNAVAIGYAAKANASAAIALGLNSNASGSDSVAIGRTTQTGVNSISIGISSQSGGDSVAIGNSASTSGKSAAVAIGNHTKALEYQAVAVGEHAQAAKWAVALGAYADANNNRALAVGYRATAVADAASSFGVRSNATAANSTALGSYANTTGKYSIAIGDNSLAGTSKEEFDAASILANEKNATEEAKNAFATLRSSGKTDTISIGHSSNVYGEHAVAVGAENKVGGENSGVLGYKNTVSNANTFVLGTNVKSTQDNSVILGANSTDRAATVETKANVGGYEYSGFSGVAKEKNGVVSVGFKEAERQIINVAAGNISATSTDAINGSQLYLVGNSIINQMPVIYTDAAGNKIYKIPDPQKPNSFIFVNENGQPVTGDIIASMNDGDNQADSPKTLANVKGNLPDTYNTDAIYNKGGQPVTQNYTLPTNLNINNAATVGDILNSGWNLQNNSQARDFVKPYDTVSFDNGLGTTATVTTDPEGKTSKVTYDVKVDDNTIAFKDDKGEPVVKANNGKFYHLSDLDKDGKPIQTAQEVPTDKVNDTISVVTGHSSAEPNGQATAFTDKAGNPLVKVNDNYYKPADVKADGTLVDNAQPVTTSDVVDNRNKVAGIGDIVDTINQTGWNVKNNGSQVDLVKPSDIVDFVNGLGTQAVAKVSEDGKTTTVTYNVNVDGKTTKITYVDENGDKVTEEVAPDGKITYKDKDGKPIDASKVKSQITAVTPMVNGEEAKGLPNIINGGTTNVYNTDNGIKVEVNTGDINAQAAGDVKGPVADADKPAYDKAKADLAKAEEALKNATTDDDKKTAQANIDAANKTLNNIGGNKIATAQNVADAINQSGWNVVSKANGGTVSGNQETKLVNPGSTVELKAGKNIDIKQEGMNFTFATVADPEFNTVTIGNPTYQDADGKAVNKAGDKYYYADGTEVPADKVVKPTSPATKLAAETAIPATNNHETNAPTTALNMTSVDGNPTHLTGVGSVLNTTTVATNPDANSSTAPVDSKLVDLGNATNPLSEQQLNSAATVRDIANMGWVISAEDGYKDTVKNANEVKFLGTGLATVSGKTDEAGVRTITVNVDAQRAVESAQLPVVYTNRDGDKLVKVEGKFYKAGDVTNGVPNQEATPVNSGDVIAAMNNGDNNTTTPMALSNVQSHLTPTTSTTQLIDKVGAVSTVEAPTTSQTAPTVAEAAKMNNKAATVGDVLNAGWNLQVNGEAKDFVKPYDTVNFGDGIGTKAEVESDGATSTIKVNIDAGSLEANADGSVRGAAPTPELAENLAKAEEALAAVEALGDKAPQNVLEAAKAAVYDAEKAIKQANANKVATVSNVVEAVNNSGWTATVGKTGTGEVVDKGGDKLVNPGDTVSMIAGDNMKITKDGLNYTVETKKEVTFDRVTANVVNVGPVSLSGSTATNPDGS
ncbi:MAG: ESPR-type extended signal peptide-containing protein, partial [[Pasteurella] mairii]|nr:ESPR-type extended signal peptide-containing protein [[Pasteurella] mairii]